MVNILYPEATALPSSKVPDLVAFNQPTTDDLTPHLLLKAIRDAVLEQFGDYGAGAIAGSLMGKTSRPIAQITSHSDIAPPYSQIFISGDFDLHYTSHAHILQDRMGCAVDDGYGAR